MRAPVEVLRGLVAEFTAVMREHEEYLLSAWEGYDDEDE